LTFDDNLCYNLIKYIYMARFGVSEIVESIMTYEKNFKDQYNWLS